MTTMRTVGVEEELLVVDPSGTPAPSSPTTPSAILLRTSSGS